MEDFVIFSFSKIKELKLIIVWSKLDETERKPTFFELSIVVCVILLI